MGNNKTQIWQQAMAIYADISNLSAKKALAHIDSIHDLSFELKQAVITLINSGNHASQYIEKNFTPDLQQFHNEMPEYELGTILGEYELVEKLGQGGMSQVFKAKRLDSEPQKMVAIKIFSPRNNSPQLLNHFINEQKILAQFNHANIVDMLHGGKTDDTAYLVMELIDDALPIDKFSKENNLSTKDKIKYIAQCADALSYSHANLIIHRDLKPDNILINKDKELKIVDFGIAKLINNDIDGQNTTIMALTPNYAAPEQINAQPITVKTDIFSLAVVALDLLCGENPLPKDRLIKSCINDNEFIDKNLKQLNCDKDLKNILRKALAQNPDERYSNMQSFADDLNYWLDDKPVKATAPSIVYRIKKFAQRRTALFATMVSFCTFLLIGSILGYQQYKQIKIEAGKALHVKQFMLNTFNVTNPNTREGIKISASDLLKIAALKLDEGKELDPAIKFELYQSLAIANDQLGYSKEAITLLKQSLLIDPNNTKSKAYLAANYQQAEEQHNLVELLSRTDESSFSSELDHAKFSLVRAKNLSINGDTEQAIALINTIQKLKSIKNTPSELANIKLALAAIYFDKSDHDKATKTLNSILSQSTLSPKNTLILSTKLELGRNYNAIGEYDLSLNELQETEHIYKQVLGDNHPDLGILYYVMASNYKAKGQLQKAHDYAQKSFEFNTRIFGGKGIQLSYSLNMLAVFAFYDGDKEKAIKLTNKAITVLEKTYDKNHPQILELKTNLAFLLGFINQKEKSLELLKEVYVLQKNKHGINHYSTIETESKIVNALLKLKKTEEAKNLALVHLQRVLKHINKKSIKMANAYSVLARVYLQTNEKQKRLESLLEIEKQKLLDETNPKYIKVVNVIAQAYDKLNDIEKADEYFKRSFALAKNIYPETHVTIVEMTLIYAKFLQSHNKKAKAIELLIEAKHIIKQKKYDKAEWNKWVKHLEKELL